MGHCSVVQDVRSLWNNIKEGNVGAAAVDGIVLVADVTGLFVPGVPSVTGARITTYRIAVKGGDIAKAVDGAVESSTSINKISNIFHGNSAASTKAQHAYDIIDTETGDVVKTGVSSGRIRLDGKSSRAESQVRQ